MSERDDQTPKRSGPRKTIPSLLSKKLYQEVDNSCPFCGIADVAVLEMHHIDENRSNNDLENLIVVCGNCHSKITHGEIPSAAVRVVKTALLWKHQASLQQANKSPAMSVSVNGDVSNSTIANNIIMHSKAQPRMQHPPDSIGADTIKHGYAQHLISRYFEYRNADASYGGSRAFSYPEIHKSIEREFKAKTFFIHVSRFGELCDYLKSRVDKTIQGKRNRSDGKPNYSTFEEYEAEQLRGR